MSEHKRPENITQWLIANYGWEGRWLLWSERQKVRIEDWYYTARRRVRAVISRHVR